MASVSLTMIVKNESKNLHACVAPIRSLFDEIVVVDTGSTDDTTQIATDLGGRVIDFPWCDSFSAARNEAIAHATGDWVFALDADDRIAESEIEKLRMLFRSLDDALVGYMVPVVNVASDGGPGTRLEQVRLFPRRPDIRWTYRVHEQIVPSIQAAGGRIVRAEPVITHTGYRDNAFAKSKLERNLRLVELDLVDRPNDIFSMFYRGATLTELGRYAEAAVTLSMCLPFVDPTSDMARSLATCLTHSLREEGRTWDALDTVRTARATSDCLTYACLEAQLLVQLDDIAGASACLSTVLPPPTSEMPIPDACARVLLAETLLTLGHAVAAAETVRPVIESRPSMSHAWLVFADALMSAERHADLDCVLLLLERVAGADPIRVAIHAARLAREGSLVQATTTVTDALRTHPDALVLRSVAETLHEGAVPRLSCSTPPWTLRKHAPIAAKNAFRFSSPEGPRP